MSSASNPSKQAMPPKKRSAPPPNTITKSPPQKVVPTISSSQKGRSGGGVLASGLAASDALKAVAFHTATASARVFGWVTSYAKY